jgi:hypothetical protein
MFLLLSGQLSFMFCEPNSATHFKIKFGRYEKKLFLRFNTPLKYHNTKRTLAEFVNRTTTVVPGEWYYITISFRSKPYWCMSRSNSSEWAWLTTFTRGCCTCLVEACRLEFLILRVGFQMLAMGKQVPLHRKPIHPNYYFNETNYFEKWCRIVKENYHKKLFCAP